MARSSYAKFATHISFYGGLCIGPVTENSIFTKIIKKLISAEECELGMHLTRTPISVEDFAKKVGRSEKEVGEMLWNMADRGTIFPHFVGGKPYYRLAPFVPGIYEYLMDKRTMDKEMAEYFVTAMEEVAWIATNVSQVDGGLMKVVPVRQELMVQPKILSHEDVMTYINNSDLFTVADCACRYALKLVGRGCEHPVEGMCLQLGPHAEYYIKTGRGRQVTKEEAIELLNKAAEAGLVHTVFGTEGTPNETSYICNCCGCSCSGLRVMRQYGGGATCTSNFRAKIDDNKCVACGGCVDICSMNAIKLGDGLCKQHEEQIDKYDTSWNTLWGKKRWDYNYRARTMVTRKGTAPCKTKCPAHISVQGYIKKAAEGKYTEALELIKKDNPFPAVCGRICPHPCEEECTRSAVDESLAIDAVKMFIADQDLNADVRFIPKIKHYDESEKANAKVAVIGSGPAGLSCAYYLAVEGYKVTVFEKEKVLGGMLTLGIPSFRLDKDVINAEIDILKVLGVEFKTGVEIGKDTTIQQLRVQGYKAFYIAIGAQKGASLGIEGEDFSGVINGVDFLRSINLDTTLKLSGPVVVVGGGNVAIDVARTAVRAGASFVNLYCLESEAEMPALKEEQEEARQEGIVLNNGWGPKRIIAKNGKVTGVEFKKCVSVFENGAFAPKYDENQTITVKASHVLLAVGQVIDWGNLDKGENFILDARKRIKVADISYQTAVPEVFAGGDVVTGPKFAIDAIALGKQGAQSIHRYLQGRDLFVCREREFKALDKTNLDISGYDLMPRQKTGAVDFAAAKSTFADLRQGLTEEQLGKEVERCLQCGVSIVDQKRCIGCGVCTRQCSFDAIHLERIGETYPVRTWTEFYARAATYAVARAGRIALKGVKNILPKEK